MAKATTEEEKISTGTVLMITLITIGSVAAVSFIIFWYCRQRRAAATDLRQHFERTNGHTGSQPMLETSADQPLSQNDHDDINTNGVESQILDNPTLTGEFL